MIGKGEVVRQGILRMQAHGPKFYGHCVRTSSTAAFQLTLASIALMEPDGKGGQVLMAAGTLDLQYNEGGARLGMWSHARP